MREPGSRTHRSQPGAVGGNEYDAAFRSQARDPISLRRPSRISTGIFLQRHREVDGPDPRLQERVLAIANGKISDPIAVRRPRRAALKLSLRFFGESNRRTAGHGRNPYGFRVAAGAAIGQALAVR